MDSRVEGDLHELAEPASYGGLMALLAQWLRVPLYSPSVPPGQRQWIRSFRPAESFLSYLKLKYGFVMGMLALVLLPLTIGVLFKLLQEGNSWIALAVLLLVVLPALLLAGVGYWALQFQFDTTWYVMTDRAIRLRSGIWILREMTVTFDNVQNVKVRQGPIQRWLGIGDVSIETAAVSASSSQNGASVASSAVVAGVADAKEIRDRIVERMRLTRSSGLGDPDEEAAWSAGVATSPGAAHPTWTPAHLKLLRELRDEASRLT